MKDEREEPRDGGAATMRGGASGVFSQGLDVPLGPRGRSPEQLNGMAHKHYQSWAIGDGATTEFALPVTILREQNVMVFVGGVLQRPASRGTGYDYAVRGLTGGWAGDSNRVRFVVAPVLNADITFWLVGG